MRFRTTPEMVTLHSTSKTLTLAYTGDIHLFANRKQADIDLVAFCNLDLFGAEFAQVP
jgi:hypothetical protein